MARPRTSVRTTVRAAVMLAVLAGIAVLTYLGIRYFIPQPLNEIYSPREIALFHQVAFRIDLDDLDTSCTIRGDCGLDPVRIVKWETDIRLWITGKVTNEDRDELLRITAELDDLLPDLSVEVTDDRLAANIIVAYNPRTDLPPDEAPHPLGFAAPRGDTLAFTTAAIFIDSLQAPRPRQVILRHELMHAIGFSFHSIAHPDSVLFVRPTDEITYPPVFSAVDNAIIRILYDPRVLPGMTLGDLQHLGL